MNILMFLMKKVGAIMASLLLKTGQTTVHETGDDGDLQKGIAKDYTVLTTDQYSGTTDITINAKTVTLLNECVQDNNTGLMWARSPPQSDIGHVNSGTLYWKDDVNGEDIFAFAAQANAQNLGGHNDWRIPNIFELLSLVDFGASYPCIDTDAFPSFPTVVFWSSTSDEDWPPCKWTVAFDYGNMECYEGGYDEGLHLVLIVRGE